MKSGERFPPDDPREWLNRARSNLALAKNHIPDAYTEVLFLSKRSSKPNLSNLEFVAV